MSALTSQYSVDSTHNVRDHEIYETCHSVTFYFMKQESTDFMPFRMSNFRLRISHRMTPLRKILG